MAKDSVQQCWRYPVKSMQGVPVPMLDIGASGVSGDRLRALRSADGEHVLSAKRHRRLLEAVATDTSVELPDGRVFDLDSQDCSALDSALSEWLGQAVNLVTADGQTLSYEMTFDPPDDDAEYYDIPTPAGSFVDLAHVHLLSAATLDGCRSARPDLNWDVRRFRPNLVLDVAGEMFHEDDWQGVEIGIGEQARLRVTQPTVRCAMPLRQQPPVRDESALERQAALFAAMSDLHPSMPNHLGVYAEVVRPGPVRIGDAVTIG